MPLDDVSIAVDINEFNPIHHDKFHKILYNYSASTMSFVYIKLRFSLLGL